MLSPPVEFPFFSPFLIIMNIIVWNCRGVLKPNFQSHVRDLVRTHNPSILVVMETRVGGDRAKEIINRLPFDGFIYTDTLGFAGGIWLLWNSDRVEVVPLATTEQEIHAEVKVLPSNLAWIFTAVYASPRIVERRVLWDNLAKVADLHRKPWIIAGDFNEPLVGDDKFGGRPVDINRVLMFKIVWIIVIWWIWGLMGRDIRGRIEGKSIASYKRELIDSL